MICLSSLEEFVQVNKAVQIRLHFGHLMIRNKSLALHSDLLQQLINLCRERLNLLAHLAHQSN